MAVPNPVSGYAIKYDSTVVGYKWRIYELLRSHHNN